MTRYFVAGNFWLFFAYMLFIGQETARTGPVYYSFFGAGFIHPASYSMLQFSTLALAAGYLYLSWKTRFKAATKPAGYADV